MKKIIIYPILLTVCSVVSAFIFHSPFTYINLFVALILLSITFFKHEETELNRIKFSSLWLLILEIVAFVLLLFDVNIYQPSLVWLMYVLFVVIEVVVMPRIAKE